MASRQAIQDAIAAYQANPTAENRARAEALGIDLSNQGTETPEEFEARQLANRQVDDRGYVERFLDDAAVPAAIAANPLAALGTAGAAVAGKTAAEGLGKLGILPGFGGSGGTPDVYRPPSDAAGTLDLDSLGRVVNRAQAGTTELVGRGYDVLDNPSEAPQAQAAQIDQRRVEQQRGLEAESRGLQLENLDRLTAAAEGRTASAAEIQQNRGVQAAIRAQLAAANSARGGGAAAIQAQRAAAQQGATLSAQAVQDAAQLRASEQERARAQLTGAVEQQRVSDLGRLGAERALATSQAEFESKANQINPQLQIDQQRVDNQLSTNLIARGLDAQKIASLTTAEKAGLLLDYEKMLTNRDVNIYAAKTAAGQKDRAAITNLLGTGLTFGATAFGGPAAGAAAGGVASGLAGAGAPTEEEWNTWRTNYGGRA